MHMQLHQCQEASDFGHLSVRTCGMEANCELQHRTKVNSRKAVRPGLARRLVRRPISSRSRKVVRAAAAGSLGLLPHESSSGPKTVGWAAMLDRCPGIPQMAYAG